MSCTSATPSPSPSEAQADQVDGMNCSGPAARAHSPEPEPEPEPEPPGTAATSPEPSSVGPRMGEDGTPSSPRLRPPNVPCCDSTQPIPASVVQPRWQPASEPARRSCAVA